MTERFCMNKGLYSFEDTITGKTYSEYNLEEIVELLNEFHKENKKLKHKIGLIYDLIDRYIAIADKYRKPIKSLNIGDDLGYWNGVYQYMKKLRGRIGVL